MKSGEQESPQTAVWVPQVSPQSAAILGNFIREIPSGLGGWSYIPIDTKLARETKAGTVLQLCLYADLLTEAQRLSPPYMYVVKPYSEFQPQPQRYRFAD